MRAMDMGNRADKKEMKALTEAAEEVAKAVTAAAKEAKHDLGSSTYIPEPGTQRWRF